VESEEDFSAWLEASDGRRLPITANCSIGRGSANDITVTSDNASRRHALIHLQDIGEFWLVDLGSTNGTLLNGRRLQKPVRLCNSDEIRICEDVLTFHQHREVSKDYQTTVAAVTIAQIQRVECWLLLADVQDFTPLSGQLPMERLAAILGEWILACKRVIEAYGGAINKYLGDGIFAYWRDAEGMPSKVVKTIEHLKKLQHGADPRFRIVVHFGMVAVGGIVSLGEESLMGKEVNLAFRLEKIAGSLGAPVAISDTAKAKLNGLVASHSLGFHSMKGFDERREVFTI
jgi:adenylate cyclase